MNAHSLAIVGLQQSEQPGGYWLISLRLESDIAESSLGHRFRLTCKQPLLQEQELTLFSAETNRLQLLTDRPLPDDLLSHPENARLIMENRETFQQALVKSARPEPLLLLGSALDIAPLLFLARRRQNVNAPTLALLHARTAFPFAVKPARFMIPGLPAEAIGACPLLEDWQIPNRLASDSGQAGCHTGSLNDLVTAWKVTQPDHTKWQIIHL